MQNGMKPVEQLKKEVAETKLPQATKELFYKVLDTADESRLSETQRMRYESDLKNYMDTMSCIEFAEIKGKAEGRHGPALHDLLNGAGWTGGSLGSCGSIRVFHGCV